MSVLGKPVSKRLEEIYEDLAKARHCPHCHSSFTVVIHNHGDSYRHCQVCDEDFSAAAA